MAGNAFGPVGAPGGTRTPDPLLRRQLLYPPELRARATPKFISGAFPGRPLYAPATLRSHKATAPAARTKTTPIGYRAATPVTGIGGTFDSSSGWFIRTDFFGASVCCDAWTVALGAGVSKTDVRCGGDAVDVVRSFLTIIETTPAPRTTTIIVARNLWKPFRSRPLESQQCNSTHTFGEGTSTLSG